MFPARLMLATTKGGYDMNLTQNEHATRARSLFTKTLRNRSAYLLAVLGLMLCAVGWSQSTAGSIEGIVTDQSGAVLPNAAVTITNQNTGAVRTAVTNTAGVYTLPNLPPGNYRAALKASGFASLTTELAVPVNGVIRWDATMKTGAVNTTITVTDSAALIDTSSHQLDATIESNAIETLPASGRTLFSALTYSTNVAGYPGNDSNDIDYFHVQNYSLTIGGSVFGVTQYTQDGVTNVNMLTRTANYQPPIEAAQEVSIIRNGASARFSSPNVVNVITKNGTNGFHGVLYDYFRNDMLNALAKNSASSAPLRYNQFGGNIGGPLLHDRLFFFFDYSGLRQHSYGMSTAIVPTVEQRNGNFSGVARIYDPSTYNPSTGAITEFPNDTIPAISSYATKILAYIPLPTPSTVQGTNYQTTLPSTSTYDSYLGRMDYNIGKQDRIYGAFMTSNPGQNSTTIFTVRTFDPRLRQGASNAYVEETHVFNSQLVNVFRIGYNRSNIFNSVAGVGEENWSHEFGLTALENNPQGQWLPPGLAFGAGGYAGWNPSVQGALQNLYQYSDELTFTRGRHTIYEGAELVRVQFNGDWLMGQPGRFTFNGQYTNNHKPAPSGGNSIADMLLGLPSIATGAIGSTVGSFRQYNVLSYIQDDWRISNRLTLNLGLRYEYYGSPADKNGKSNVYDVPTNTNHPGTFLQTYNNWAPRFGLAYSLRPTTSIRGGYGIYYAGIQYNELQFMMANPPNLMVQNYTYPNTQMVPVEQALVSNPLTSSQAPYTVALRMPTPYAQQRNLSIQQSFGNNTTVEVAYLGSNSLHLMRRVDANQAYLAADPNNPAPQASRRPYSWVGSVLEARNTEQANYNGLELAVRRDYAKYYNLFANAVYSKSLDTASSEQDVPQYLYDMDAEHGRSSFGRKFVFKVGGQARLGIVGRRDALIHTDNMFVDQTLGNWRLSGAVQVLSGLPYVVSASEVSFTGSWHGGRANESCNGNEVEGRSLQKWFNTACYVQPVPYTVGSERRNNLIGPKQTQTDLSLFKSFPFGETRSATLRLDAFGVFNHPLPGLPNANLTSKSNFGMVTSFGGSRVLQISAKINF